MKEKRQYCEIFDAHFHAETREWLDKKCSNADGLCPYCPGRPEIHPFSCQCLDEKEKTLDPFIEQFLDQIIREAVKDIKEKFNAKAR